MHRPLTPLLSCALAATVLLAGCARPGSQRAVFDPDSIPEAYARPGAALMWPGATRAFQVTPEGDLYNGEWLTRFRLSSGGTSATPPRHIAFEARWMPVARWTRAAGDVRWGFESVALPAPGPRDSGLIVTLEVTATNTGGAAHPARFELQLLAPGRPVFVAWDAPDSAVSPLRIGSGAGRDTLNACWPGLAPGAPPVADWTLAPGASRTLRLVLPVYPTPARELAAWARVPHEKRVAEARAWWTRTLDSGTRFALGDPEVEDALRAALVTLLSLRERHGAVTAPLANPFQYRDVWLRDAARHVRALAVTAHTREARELCRALELLQWPSGAFLSQRGQLDGTGQALWAFEQAMLRPAPDDSVARYAAAAERAWRWFEWQRDMGRQSGWEFGRMLPYGEPRDNELTRAQLVGNDAWALAGYRAAARLLAAAKRGAEAESVEAARDRYVADFHQALERSGSPDVPPSWQGAGRDWGNLTVASPCGVLAPGDARVERLARRVWAAAGGAGLLTYGSPDTLHHYLGADLATWALLAGHPAEADSVLTAMLHWRTASGGAAELFSRSTRDYGTNLPPHATSAAVLVGLVRDALVHDEGDTLRLTLGARPAWWKDGRVSRAPTRWGMLDLRFRRAGATAEWEWSAVPVWTALTLPPGSRLAASPAAPLVRGLSDHVVLAPPGTRSARVALADAP